MASLQDMQQEALATIDTAKVLVDKVLSIFDFVTLSPSLTISGQFAMNPIGYLLQLLERAGVTYDELLEWLSNFIIYIVPLLEVSVKAVMLTNLKNMVTCTADPRIPDKYRKRHKEPTNYNTSQEYGIDISLESIDFFNKLTINPLGDGKYLYFGLDNVDNVYKFARAEDFDAFLWFVIHKGHFPNSSEITDMTNINGSSSVEGNSLLDVVKVNYDSASPSKILPGNTFIYDGSSQIISLCIDGTYDSDNNIVQNTLVPVSDDWNSVNWYVRRGDYYTKNLGVGSGNTRDYSKESGICNIQFLDQANASDSPLTGLVNNKFRFTILPKPYVHIPNLDASEPPWRFKKLLFDSKGNYDPNGKYTIVQSIGEQLVCFDNNGQIVDCESEYVVRKIVKFTGFTEGQDPELSIDPKSGNVKVENKQALIKYLIECYPGLTVYEFNYDYVMSMKLFDAKVLASNLIARLSSLRIGGSLSMGMGHQNGTEEIKEIIKNIVESDEISVDDCFFEFSNDKYDALLKRAEKAKAKKIDLTEAREILEEFKEDAELNKQVDILNRAITQATVSVTEGLPEQDKFNVRFNLITDFIEQLTSLLIETILTPKVLMLFEVNETIMGGKWQKLSVKDLIKSMRDIIIAIIKEIRDLIIQELLKLLLKVLSPIIAVLLSSLVREQLEAYAEAIDEIIRNCPRIWFSFGRNVNSETKLDVVDYADIDTSETKGGDSPQLKNC